MVMVPLQTYMQSMPRCYLEIGPTKERTAPCLLADSYGSRNGNTEPRVLMQKELPGVFVAGLESLLDTPAFLKVETEGGVHRIVPKSQTGRSDLYNALARKITEQYKCILSAVEKRRTAPLPELLELYRRSTVGTYPGVTFSRAEEICFFRLFNWYKHQLLRSCRIMPKQAVKDKPSQFLAIMDLQKKAHEIGDRIIVANEGLVYQVRNLKNILDPDAISDMYFALLQARDGFDVARGFRFSTYAMRSIIRRAGVYQNKQLKYCSRNVSYEPQFEKPDLHAIRDMEDENHNLHALHTVLANNSAQLTPIESEILSRRYGLVDGHLPETLEAVGKSKHLSKERIRQIQLRAQGKLFDAVRALLQEPERRIG